MSTMGYVSTLEGASASASLSLDFEKQSYRVLEGGKQVNKGFDELFTFSRSTTGGRFNQKGRYETVPANQPRFDYHPITKVLRGILSEEQRTNLVRDSNLTTFAGTWIRAGGTVIGAPTLAPDGVSAATSLSNTPGVSSYISQGAAVPSEGVYTITFFCKPEEGFSFNLIFETVGIITFNSTSKTFSGGAALSTSYIDLPDGWIRGSITTAVGKFALYIGAYGSTPAQHKGYLWGVQVESATSSTSYIPTSLKFTSRSSSATYFDENGVLKIAGQNVARDSAFVHNSSGELLRLGLISEYGVSNLLKRAGDLMSSPAWNNVGNVTVTRATGLDGGLTANRIIERAWMGVKEVAQSGVPVVAGTTYTFSVYAKPIPGADRQLRIGFGNGSVLAGGAQAVFNLKDHTIAIVQGGTYSIQRIGGGWARYSYTVVAENTLNSPVYLTLLSLGSAGYQGDGSSGCIVYGAQLEVGAAPTSYIPPAGTFTSRTTTATYLDSAGLMQTAAANVGRGDAYGYDVDSSGVLKPIGLLLERSSTNLLSYSEDYTTGTAGTWSNLGPGTLTLGITANAANGTRGPNTMTLVERRDLGVKYLSKVFIAGAGTVITRTQRVKASANSPDGTCLTMRLQTESYANRVDAWFNVTTGECVAQRIGDCELLGVSMTKERDGVWLCTLTGKSGVGVWGSVGMSVLDRAGTIDSSPTALCSVYIDCAQLEVGPDATSYIPTTTASVTRAVDVSNAVVSTRAADITTATTATRAYDKLNVKSLSPWYNTPESSFTAEFTCGAVGAGNAALAFRLRSLASTNVNAASLYRSLSGAITGIVIDGAGVVQMQGNFANAAPDGVRANASMGYKFNSGAVTVGGRVPLEDTTLILPAPEVLHIGQNGSDSMSLNGWVHSINYYPQRLSSTQLQIISG